MDWKVVHHQKIQQRNLEEYQRIEYYSEYIEKQWKIQSRWENQRLSLRHKLNLVEYDASETSTKSDPTSSLFSIRRKLDALQAEVNEYIPSLRINLSKTIHDQKLLLSNQYEELALAKKELQSALEQIAILTTMTAESTRSIEPTENIS